MATPEQISKDKDRLVSRLVKQVKDESGSLENAVVRALLNELTKQSRGGRLDSGVNELSILRKIKRIIRESVNDSAVSQVSSVLPNFKRMFELNARMHADINNIDLKASDFSRLRTAFADLMVDELTDTANSPQLLTPIRNVLTRNILTGATLSKTESDLMRSLTGRGQQVGKLQARVTQITRDTMYGFDGAVNKQVAENFDLNAYRYVGSLVKDSRPQCRRWVAKGTLLIAELEDEISWAKTNGSGMRPTTTTETFPIDRGGYNCRHEAIPIQKN